MHVLSWLVSTAFVNFLKEVQNLKFCFDGSSGGDGGMKAVIGSVLLIPLWPHPEVFLKFLTGKLQALPKSQ